MDNPKKDTTVYVAYEEFVPFDPVEPERNLLRAILRSALSDVKKGGEVGKLAEEFFLSPDEDYIFSFRSICDLLSLDASQVLLITGLKGNSDENETLREHSPEHKSDLTVN